MPLPSITKSTLLTTSSPTLELSPTLTTSFVASATPPLDSKVEYMDKDGILRRSEKVTRRMLQRGHSIAKAVTLTVDEQAHTSLAMRLKETQERNAEVSEALRELEKKQKANADLKREGKQARQQWIDEGDELVSTRLQLWYDNRYVPKDEPALDLTEVNTARSPSKSMTFIDNDGNLRRKVPPPTPDLHLDAVKCDGALENNASPVSLVS
ncbi:hypothetical protein Poli38472_001839 [Pythium oligandrum]|uniref:Uncharacterized protein n=1 Tax=Pythium oligandrum TaxID=41045 RepID=A0A8K1CWT0_PYTOL|nr:hypothetical protein Poli38472_001839 [Pythium oligandrum]|eukprot:TMW69683.1 hypothetical protein Poli38472_001839 [Pythium oligandrum]